VVPIGLLALARWSVWSWATDRILSRTNLLRWGAVTTLAGLWIVGCLAFRAWEVPPHDEPFNVAEFKAGYRAIEKSEAPQLIRQAVNQREQHVQRLIETGLLPPNFNNQSTPPNQEQVFTFGRRLNAVAVDGWRAADGTFDVHLDRIAAG